jgi:predicted TIM-barrel fold metal-dependent hydrolase
VPARYREYAPERFSLPNGGDAFRIKDGGRAQKGGMNLYSGSTPEDYWPGAQRWDDCPGTGSPEQRLREQDQDGIDAEILYPGPGSRGLLTGVKHAEVSRALIRAYNEFQAREFCAVNPDRLLALGVLPDTGVDAAIEEMTHCKELGCKGAYLGTYPSGLGYPTPEDDRFWAAALDLEMPITIHVSIGGIHQPRPQFQYPLDLPAEERPGDLLERCTRYARAGGVNAVQMVLAGVFDRFPALQIYMAENQIGWIPCFLEQTDNNYERNCHWAERGLGVPVLQRRPSEYIKDHFLWGFMYDRLGVRLRHDIGVDRLMWGSDFPHIESDWPSSMHIIEQSFVGVPEDEKRRMLAGNCIDFFRLDDE